jgi:predicted transcriptional regulator
MFPSHIFRDITSSDYSDDVLIKLFNMSDKEKSIREIYSLRIRGSESELEAVLRCRYPEEILNEIIERCENVLLKEIRTAKEMGYSAELIKKMEAKCSDKGWCVIA